MRMRLGDVWKVKTDDLVEVTFAEKVRDLSIISNRIKGHNFGNLKAVMANFNLDFSKTVNQDEPNPLASWATCEAVGLPKESQA